MISRSGPASRASLAAVVCCLALVACGGSARIPGAPPTSAAASARQLAGGGPEEVRAVSPSLASVLGGRPFLPAGSRLVLAVSGWHQRGRFATTTATLHLVGGSKQPVDVGYMKASGRWIITYVGSR
jgi:hypothetical protein